MTADKNTGKHINVGLDSNCVCVNSSSIILWCCTVSHLKDSSQIKQDQLNELRPTFRVNPFILHRFFPCCFSLRQIEYLLSKRVSLYGRGVRMHDQTPDS